MILHTVFISYNRVDLTRRALASYRETVTVPHTLVVVDNGSDHEAMLWLDEITGPGELLLLGRNRYPGFACNRGFDQAPDEATVLHRADNDFVFLPGWSDEVKERFDANPLLGQLGLRTGDEELHNGHNVGGNCAFRRELWREGLRWKETPWPKIKTPGYTEDSFMSPEVARRGWEWGRVERPCIQSISVESPDDPYYARTWADRGIVRD
jgi:hypothetical protein